MNIRIWTWCVAVCLNFLKSRDDMDLLWNRDSPGWNSFWTYHQYIRVTWFFPLTFWLQQVSLSLYKQCWELFWKCSWTNLYLGKQPIYAWVGRFFNRIVSWSMYGSHVYMLWSTHASRVLIMRPRWNFVVLRLQPFCNKLRRAQWRMRFSISTQLLDMKYHLKKDPMFFKDFCVNIIVMVLECNHFINADKCRYMHIQTLHVRNICLPLVLNLIKTFMWVNMPVPSMEHLRDSSLNAWFIRSNHVSRLMFKNWRFFSPWYKPANCSEEWKFLPEITRWCKIKIYLGLFGAPILLSPLN